MIATNPDYINGDKISLKQYFTTTFLKNKRLVYSSVWSWWKKTTTFWCIPLLVGDLTMLIPLVYQDWEAGESFHWPLIIGMFCTMFVSFLPFIWAISYYQSFVGFKKVTQRLSKFFTTYIPDATNVRRLSYTNYVFLWKEYEFEVAHSLVPIINAKKKIIGFKPCFLVCLYFTPKHGHESDILDKQGQLQKKFEEEIYAYCKDKESCKSLQVTPIKCTLSTL